LDKDANLTHTIPADDLKASDNLAKEQIKVRSNLLKLQLPAALYVRTDPHESPAALKAELMARMGPAQGAETTDTRSEAEQYEGCVHDDYVTHINGLLAQLSDRLTLGAHVLMAHDYDLQMQRVTLVAPQTKDLAQAAFGREGVPTNKNVLAALELDGGTHESGHRTSSDSQSLLGCITVQ
jgi:hypothetical protein